jgi:F0F1-type ATP synthase delta subunit
MEYLISENANENEIITVTVDLSEEQQKELEEALRNAPQCEIKIDR